MAYTDRVDEAQPNGEQPKGLSDADKKCLMLHLQVGHDVFENRRVLLFQHILQADDDWNYILHKVLLLDLHTE